MQRYGFPIALIVLAAVLQGKFPTMLIFKGARPDLILVVLVATTLSRDPVAGGVLGFIAGFVHGSLVGYSMGSFIVSRTLIGFIAGSITSRLFSNNPIVPVLAAGGLTFVGEAVFLLANPIPDIGSLLGIVLLKSFYNSLLTIIIFRFLTWTEIRRKIKLATSRV